MRIFLSITYIILVAFASIEFAWISLSDFAKENPLRNKLCKNPDSLISPTLIIVAEILYYFISLFSNNN
jgi:hypothetical protein